MAATASEDPPLPPPPELYPLPDAPIYKRYSVSQSSQPPPNDSEIAVVIDNGSSLFRAGFSTDTNFRFACTPQIARYRDRKANRTYLICGNDILADATSRAQAKSAFDGNIVINFDVMEGLLDYSFLKLGLKGTGDGIHHPIVMTEAVCNPNYSRKVMTEMLFEAYNAPSIAYGIDALFSYAYNKGTSGLVISSSSTATHIIPVYDGRGLMPLATRLNWGSLQSSDYLLKLLTLKYPSISTKLNNWQAESLMIEHCYVSDDYKKEASDYLQPATLMKKDRVIQYPFTETVIAQKSEEELAKAAERKKESGRRLQEQAARMRLEKLVKKEQELDALRDLQQKSQSENKRNFQRMLDSYDFKDEAALQRAIKELDKAVKRARKQDVGEDEAEEVPTFPLLDIPDEELDEAQLKQKKTQRLMKSNWDARQRAKAEKEREKARIAEEERKDELFRNEDLDAWIEDKRAQRSVLISRIQARQRLKSDLTDRKSLASQLRMKNLANLASDFPGASSRRRNPSGNPDDNDNFGANDDDWAVYRQIGSNPNDAVDDEDEEKELEAQVKVLEDTLHKHDPGFASHLARETQGDWRNSLIHHFLHGCRPFNPDENQAEAHQVHLNVERIRVLEPVFNPAMAGLEQSGLIEIAADVLLHRISDPVRRAALAQDVFLTGGNTSFDGFTARVQKELTMVLEWGTPLNVRRANNPIDDAWKGAAQWARSEPDYKRVRVTRQEYEESGSDYMKEHRLGNALV